MSPKPDLHGPRAKLARAVEHREQFEDALYQWAARRPIGIRQQRDAGGWTNVIYVEREPIPLRVGAIFADVVNNLASALHLLVAQLVIASGNTPSTGNHFPVVTDPARWESARKDKLRGVKDNWADVIRHVQPFNDKPNAYKHALVLLHTANETNRQNVPMPAVVRNMGWEPTFRLNRDVQEGEFTVSELDPLGTGPKLCNGDVLVRVRVASVTGDVEITRFASGDIPAAVDIGWEDLPIGFKRNDEFPGLFRYVVGVIDEFM
jgi:hypothetical protein